MAVWAMFEAIQVKLDRRVALKVLRLDFTRNSSYVKRFKFEAKLAAALNHPNIIQVYDTGEDSGYCFFAMEFVNGKSVGEGLKREGKFSQDKALRIAQSVAAALLVAHTKSIIHRDIKPDNIMLTDDGEVKLADLGLAKRIDGDSDLTQAGVGMGTIHSSSLYEPRSKFIPISEGYFHATFPAFSGFRSWQHAAGRWTSSYDICKSDSFPRKHPDPI